MSLIIAQSRDRRWEPGLRAHSQPRGRLCPARPWSRAAGAREAGRALWAELEHPFEKGES